MKDYEEDPIKLLMQEDAIGILDNLLYCLTLRESQIIKWRFGIEGKKLTLKAVSEKLDISAVRVSQLQAKALRKIRKKINNNDKSFTCGLHSSDKQIEEQKREDDFRKKYKKWM